MLSAYLQYSHQLSMKPMIELAYRAWLPMADAADCRTNWEVIK